MGLLDRALEALGNKQPLPLMDTRAKLLQAALALVADDSRAGGLQGLVDRFRGAGLDNAISSWIGTEENVPVTGPQLRQALGEDQVQQISADTGLPPDETADHLSDMLPDIVDRLTPAGHIPPGGLGHMSALLDHFIGRRL